MSRVAKGDSSDTDSVDQNVTLIQNMTPSGSDSDDVLDSENEDWDINSEFDDLPSKPEAEVLEQLRQDLLVAKEAGFRVGYLGSLDDVFVVSLACRISRLGINEDVMQAWNVKPSEYIVLLIRYLSPYRRFEEIIEVGDRHRLAIQLHVGLCDSYKPGFEHVRRLFTDGSAHRSTVQGDIKTGEMESELRPLFIGDTLNRLLNDRLHAILKSRWQFGFSWKGAELFSHHNQGKLSDCNTDLSEKYFQPDIYGDAGPEFLAFDHIEECNGKASQISYPLLAMQFTLRHFVYCTKFCLVCHCRLEEGYESLRPYVCSNDLCVYQYLSLGMGTALEYEIRTEPYVVDLLISLTYSRASTDKLDDLPSGLRLMVPGLPKGEETDYSRAIWEKETMTVRFNRPHPFKVGDWIVLQTEENDEHKAEAWHCRVQSSGAPGILHLSRAVKTQHRTKENTQETPEQSHTKVQVVPYKKNFDELDLNEKRSILLSILNTLPSVDQMTAFLGAPSTGRALSDWKERISPAALGILRWIVTSNRSYIKLDNHDNSENKIPRMHDFMQFRFVQGAPDKEHEFTKAVIKHGHSTSPVYPTIFAWHGSPLHNWHSILRQGLRFDYTTHGRSYGDGVYFSSLFRKANSYASTSTPVWPNSKINTHNVISLNEIVNDTENFIHSDNCFVVDKLDWIQTRFLFVKPRVSARFQTPDSPQTRSAPSAVYEQDPSHLAQGPFGTGLRIPASALGRRRWDLGNLGSIPGRPAINLCRKRKRDVTSAKFDDYDDASMETDSEDLELLLHDDESEVRDFIPGNLTEGSLPLIDPPAYATDPTTALLQTHLQEILEIQKENSHQTLGWYINPDLIRTVYQWIVELHSFDHTLPLAQDLKKAHMNSVVLELRFLPGYPTAPPFVRVIRPRILEFGAGGGGPVTTGGAFCQEELTDSGWSESMSIYHLLQNLRAALCHLDPRPVRVATASRQRDYSLQGALDTYRTMCKTQRWSFHADLDHLTD